MEKIGLGPFLKEVEECINNLSKEEIKSMLMEKARNTKPDERHLFLSEIKSAMLDRLKNNSSVSQDGISNSVLEHDKKLNESEKDVLLNDIDDFVKEINEGEYSQGWGWDDEIHDEREFGDESWVDEMDNLFDRTDDIFLSGDMEGACCSYGKLLKAFHLGEESGHFSGQSSPEEMVSTDVSEAKNRYLRALYEITDKKNRAETIFKEIEDLAYIGAHDFNLNVIEEALPAKPENWDIFLMDMKKILLREVIKDVGTRWGYGENNFNMVCYIIEKLEGIKGLEKFAEEYGEKVYKAYLVLVTKLYELQMYRESLESYQKGLKVIPTQNFIRAQISDLAAKSAESIKDKETAFNAYKEAFFSHPSLKRLLALRKSSNELCKANIMEDVVDFLEKHQWKGSFIDNSKTLLIQSYILTEKYDKMWEVTKKEEPLGWSFGDNSQAIAVPFLLMSCVRKMSLKSNSAIKKVWDWNRFDDDKSDFKNIVEREILSKDISLEERIKQVEWVKITIEKRIDAIVSNKHRGSYDKAALLLFGCTETLNMLDKSDEAQSFFNKIKLRYNHYSAFQREIKSLQI
ncbi:MAG: hypothetical protein ABH873_08560 [Candidatus Firestonebacteria bacterium]